MSAPAVRTWALSPFWRRLNAVAWLPLVLAGSYLLLGPGRSAAGSRGVLLALAGLGYAVLVLRPAWTVTLAGNELTFRGPLRTVRADVGDVREIRVSRFQLLGSLPVVVETTTGRVTVDPHVPDLAEFAAAVRSANRQVRVTGL